VAGEEEEVLVVVAGVVSSAMHDAAVAEPAEGMIEADDIAAADGRAPGFALRGLPGFVLEAAIDYLLEVCRAESLGEGKE